MDYYHLGSVFFLLFIQIDLVLLCGRPAALTIIELNQEIDKRGVVSNGLETVQCSKAYDICYFSIALSHCVTEILKL